MFYFLRTLFEKKNTIAKIKLDHKATSLKLITKIQSICKYTNTPIYLYDTLKIKGTLTKIINNILYWDQIRIFRFIFECACIFKNNSLNLKFYIVRLG